MTVGGDGETVDAQPIGVRGPEIVDWDTILDGRKNYYRITRKDGSQEGFSGFIILLMYSFRHDLDEIFGVGKKKYADKIGQGPYDYIRIAMEYLCMMYDTERVKFLIAVEDQRVTRWNLYERCGVYSATICDSRYEFYLVEKEYDHGARKMKSMLNIKLVENGISELAKDLVKTILKQIEEATKQSRAKYFW